MTIHIYLKSEILATKIRMAEICRVLLVTLLLYLFWLPSDTRGGSLITDSGSIDEDVKTTSEAYTDTTEAEAGAAAGNLAAGAADGEMTSPFSLGDRYIMQQLKYYFSSGCKEPTKSDVQTLLRNLQGPGFSPGQQYIIKLLLSYITSGCKEPWKTVEGIAVGTTPGSDFSPGEQYISKILSSYFTSGCAAAKAHVSSGVTIIPEGDYSVGESFIIEILKAYVTHDCNAAKAGLSEGGENGTDGRLLQSVVLELFLLIFGVCLTWIEL